MAGTQGEEYLGLPVLSEGEYEMVGEYLKPGRKEGVLCIEDLFQTVLDRRPNIRKLINYITDIDQSDLENGLTEEELYVCGGIESGFEFIVGCFTYTFFLRSGRISIEDYLECLPKATHVLPLRKESQLRRTIRYMSGTAIIEFTHRDWVDDSCELVALDVGDYFYEDPFMEALVDGEKEVLEDTIYDNGKYIEGFEVGVNNAIVMYIQSREQQILNRDRRDLAQNH